MKKRLIFITFIILFAFGMQSGFLTTTFVVGFMQGWNSYEPEQTEDIMFMDVHLLPEISGKTVSELINEKTGEAIPANIKTAMIEIAPDRFYQVFEVLNGFLLLGLIFAISFHFIKIIIAVNRSVVFDWQNVKRIRYMGVGLLLVFVLDFANFIYSKILVKQLLEVDGYRMVGDQSFSFLFFILGLSAFLIAEVFAIGLKLKEEQELTI